MHVGGALGRAMIGISRRTRHAMSRHACRLRAMAGLDDRTGPGGHASVSRPSRLRRLLIDRRARVATAQKQVGHAIQASCRLLLCDVPARRGSFNNCMRFASVIVMLATLMTLSAALCLVEARRHVEIVAERQPALLLVVAKIARPRWTSFELRMGASLEPQSGL